MWGVRLRDSAGRPLLAVAVREGEVFIFVSAHHVLWLSLAGWERRALRGDAPLWRGGGERDRGKFATLRLTARVAASLGAHTGTEP